MGDSQFALMRRLKTDINPRSDFTEEGPGVAEVSGIEGCLVSFAGVARAGSSVFFWLRVAWAAAFARPALALALAKKLAASSWDSPLLLMQLAALPRFDIQGPHEKLRIRGRIYGIRVLRFRKGFYGSGAFSTVPGPVSTVPGLFSTVPGPVSTVPGASFFFKHTFKTL